MEKFTRTDRDIKCSKCGENGTHGIKYEAYAAGGERIVVKCSACGAHIATRLCQDVAPEAEAAMEPVPGIYLHVPYEPGSHRDGVRGSVPDIHTERRPSLRATLLVLRLSDEHLSTIEEWPGSDQEARLCDTIAELIADAKERAAKSLVHEKGI